jgi:hypothetical protein
MAIDPTSKIFTWTPMIRMSDMKYPVYLSDFLKEHTNVSIGDFVWEYEMAEIWNYFKVYDSEVPVGDVVKEGKPELHEDGFWYKTWTVRDFSPEEVAENLARAQEDHRIRAYQVFSSDLASGVQVAGEIFSVEPRELVNLKTTRDYAVANPDETILVRKADYSILSLPSADAIEKIDAISVATGKVQQTLLTYIKSVYESTLITDIPEVPSTFVGE